MQDNRSTCMQSRRLQTQIPSIQLSVKVVQGVDPHVHSYAATGEETSPPPSIVFSAELKVHDCDCNLSACDEKNAKYHDEKSVHIVELIHPRNGEMS